MILLDTNALLYLVRGHRRSAPLRTHRGRLALSPVSALELKLLQESGRVRFLQSGLVEALKNDPRFAWDDVSVEELVAQAFDLTFTRDPFDRLLAAHATLRGWKLATSDQLLLEQLPSRLLLEL